MTKKRFCCENISKIENYESVKKEAKGVEEEV